ncbi:hypothetical protein [Aquabacterium sp.]|uniref:hypothetical protein n=1 Tax=Aquabacterium sp. TaxID=1872578 RepID=UPI002BFE00BB|nr:hypothetical protein [Aquabacterium sp.]HSW05948.1 hypothetical protein [Aquabacterium sp.]
MNRFLSSSITLTLAAALAACAARDNPRAEAKPAGPAAPLAFTSAVVSPVGGHPAPQEPLDTTVITPVETVGASLSE